MTRGHGHGHGLAGLTATLGDPPWRFPLPGSKCLGNSRHRVSQRVLHAGNNHLQLLTRLGVCRKIDVNSLNSLPETASPYPLETNAEGTVAPKAELPGQHHTGRTQHEGHEPVLPRVHATPQLWISMGAQESLFLPTTELASWPPCRDLVLGALGGRDISAKGGG